MIVGGYTLDLYCDVPACRNGQARGGYAPAQFFGNSRAATTAQAVAAGWVVEHALSICRCPEHKRWKPTKER